MTWTLCIDFGTTNTAAAFAEGAGAPAPVQLGASGELMPSGVFVESPEALFAGDQAKAAATRKPAAYMPAPKRAVGYAVITVNSYDLDPDVVVGTVLREALDRGVEAHAAHGGDTSKPDQLVLTHPAGWDARQVRVLFAAASWIGFDHDHVRAVPEPQALVFGATGGQQVPPGVKFAVLDLGAGDLSVAVLAATPAGTFDVLAAGGDQAVSGSGFDATIRRWVDQHLHHQYPAVLDRLRQSAAPAELLALEQSITAAKEALSVQESAAIDVPGGVRLELSRREFETLIHDDLVKTRQVFERTLGQAGAAPHDLHALYLTGGSSHIPAVRQVLAPVSPQLVAEQPRTAIASGALVALSRGQGSGYPAEPVRAAPTFTGAGAPPAGESSSSGGGRRWALIAAAAVAAVVVVGGGTVFALTGGDDTAVASTASDPVADEAAAKDLITRYIEEADTGGPDEMNPMRCAEKQWVVDADHPVPEPGIEHVVDNVGKVSLNGDSASARVRFAEKADGQDDRILTYVMGLEREDDGWKICSSRPQ